jgi:outer membrane protein TolC
LRWAAYGFDLSVGLQEGVVGRTFADTGERTIYGAQIGWTFRPSQVGEIRATGARLEASRVEELKTRQRIRREVVTAREELEVARQNLGFAGEALGAAERALQLSRVRFSGGLGGALDVLEAQEALAAARVRAVAVLVDAHRAVFEMQRALGAASTPTTSEPSPSK